MTAVPEAPSGSGAAQPATNVLAVVSFALSFVVAIGAVVCGHIALQQIRHSGEAGRGFAIAGLIIGYAHLAALVLAAIVFSVLAVAVALGILSVAAHQASLGSY